MHPDLLNENDINYIIKDLKNKNHNKSYFLQEFLDTDNNIGNLSSSINSFDKLLLSNELDIIWR